jgi:hypothetical protein
MALLSTNQFGQLSVESGQGDPTRADSTAKGNTYANFPDCRLSSLSDRLIRAYVVAGVSCTGLHTHIGAPPHVPQ